MNATIVKELHGLPHDIDLVVGVPRSGLLAANLLSLNMNIPMTDLDSFIAGNVFSVGLTKNIPSFRTMSEMRKVLILDDSISTGAAISETKKKIMESGITADLVFAAVYGSHDNHAEIDCVFEVVPQPRLFQWNFMHHWLLEKACVDIDGVLCADPTEEENDDGWAYEEFLQNVPCLHRPSRFVACLVTSRLERYRPQTEAWLARNAIEYGKLVMLDLPNKEERQRRNIHADFKAEFYGKSDAALFIESSHEQAVVIARKARKPVLCIETHQMLYPEGADGNQDSELPSRSRVGNFERSPSSTSLGYVLIDATDRSKPKTIISCLGSVSENLAEAIESIRQVCIGRGEYPVIVLSKFNQELMRSCGSPVEFIPEMAHLPMLSSGEYKRYINRRWAMLLQKWSIATEVTLGSTFEEFLALQLRRSPDAAQ